MSTWLDNTAPLALPGLNDLPDHTDVLVIGGGLAGVAAALYLAEGKVTVTLVEARERLGSSTSGRHLGHAFTGLVEHPYRLVHAIGEEQARALYRFSAESLDLLDEHDLLDRSGGWWIALDDREPDQIRDSAAALATLGVEAKVVSADEVNQRFHAEHFGPALFTPADGLIHPVRAVQTLASAAQAAGAHLHTGCRVTGMTRDDSAWVVSIGDRTIRTDAILFAANGAAADVHPWFAEKVHPVREQVLALAPTEVQIDAARAGYAYTFFRQDDAGRLLVGGARWATQHMEVGELDDTVIVDKIQGKLEDFVKRCFPQIDPTVVDRWAYVNSGTCDGLPIIGPLPGAPTLVACLGFVGNQPGLGLRAARAVADGLLTGTADGVPSIFDTGRMV